MNIDNNNNSPDGYGKANDREHRKRPQDGYTVDENLNTDPVDSESLDIAVEIAELEFDRYTISHPTLLPDGVFTHEVGYVKCSNQAFCITGSAKLPPSQQPAVDPTEIELLIARVTVQTFLEGFPFQSNDDRIIALAAMVEPMVYLHFDAAEAPTYLMVGNTMYAEKLKRTIGNMYPKVYSQRLIVSRTLPDTVGTDVLSILFREDTDMTSSEVPIEVNVDYLLSSLATLVSHWSSEGRPLGEPSILGSSQYARIVDGVLRSSELINPKKLKS